MGGLFSALIVQVLAQRRELRLAHLLLVLDLRLKVLGVGRRLKVVIVDGIEIAARVIDEIQRLLKMPLVLKDLETGLQIKTLFIERSLLFETHILLHVSVQIRVAPVL